MTLPADIYLQSVSASIGVVETRFIDEGARRLPKRSRPRVAAQIRRREAS